MTPLVLVQVMRGRVSPFFPVLAYRGKRPSRSSRTQRAISRTHATSDGPTAIHSRDRLPTFGRSDGS